MCCSTYKTLFLVVPDMLESHAKQQEALKKAVHVPQVWKFSALKIFYQLLSRQKLNVKIKYTYTCYIVELLGGEIFVTQKFNTQIIFTAKISRSMVCGQYNGTPKMLAKDAVSVMNELTTQKL